MVIASLQLFNTQSFVGKKLPEKDVSPDLIKTVIHICYVHMNRFSHAIERKQTKRPTKETKPEGVWK